MPNVLLTPTQVTRKALMILHQKLNFVGSINRQYDDSFAKPGAKIGDTLKIRLPNQYVVRSGASLSAQDTTETSVTLQVATQKGVDLNFTSADLTLSLDDFSERILEPAMSVLAAHVEADAMSMYKDVWNQTNNHGSAATFARILAGRKNLVDNLAPLSDRTCNLNTQDNVDLVDALKGLFHDSKEVAKQYKEGYLGRTAGFDFVENTLWPSHPRSAANGAYLVNGASQVGATLTVDTGANAPAAGDIFTIAGTASTAHGISMGYHKDAFAIATADLVMPKGVDFSAREVHDGVSLRIVRQYDINNDKFPCRLDILYGYKTIRPQLANRYANN